MTLIEFCLGHGRAPWDSSAALMVVAETLISGLTQALEPDGARRIRDMEQLR